MRARHRRTLERLFSQPTPANIRWHEVVSLMDALDMHITERSGSRVAFQSSRETLVVHQPHPRPEIDRNAARAIARFLKDQGITP